MSKLSLVASRFEVTGHGFKNHRVFAERRAQDTWVITTGEGSVLNILGEFECEPSPSNTTSEQIIRTRFTSLEYALLNFEHHLPKFGPQW